MKILIVSFSVNGAIGDYFTNVARYLAKDNDLYVLTNTGISSSIGTEDICSVRFDRKHPIDFINPRSYYKVYRYIKSKTFDVCFIASFHPVNFWIYSIVDNRKIVPFVHDHILHSGSVGIDYLVNSCMLHLYYKKSARIIVSCNRIKEDIIEKSLMTNPDKISVIYLGLLENHIFPISDIKEDIDVLFFGRIEHYKGLDVLIDAAKELLEYNFCIVGKKNQAYEKDLEYPANLKRIDSYVSDEDLALYIQRSKVVVLPYRDATGTQTIQTISYYKKPIIATRVGCFPEYIEEGRTGLIIESENKIQLIESIKSLLSDDCLRKSYGNSAYEKLSVDFSNEKINKQYWEVFQLVK